MNRYAEVIELFNGPITAVLVGSLNWNLLSAFFGVSANPLHAFRENQRSSFGSLRSGGLPSAVTTI
jgi:hypothetical protein